MKRSTPAIGAFVLLGLIFISPVWSTHCAWNFVATLSEPGGDLEPADRSILIILPGLAGAVLSNELNVGSDLGAVALLNVQTLGGPQMSAACATLSAGSRARGLSDLHLVYDGADRQPVMEGTVRQFHLWYGRAVPSDGAAFVDWPRLADKNSQPAREADVGLLGERIRSAGLRTAYVRGVGADGAGGIIAADRSGVVDRYIPPSVVSAPCELIPGGTRTDWSSVVRVCSQLPDDVGLTVVEAGDLLLVPDWLPHEVAAPLREGLLHAALQGAGELADAHEGAQVLLIDPKSGPGGMGLIAAPARGDDGILTSSTTRRPGLVSLSDVGATLWTAGRTACTVTAARSLRTVQVQVQGNALAAVQHLHYGVQEARAMRAPLAQFMVALVVTSALLIAAGILWMPGAYFVAAHTMAALALLPPAALISPAFASLSSPVRLVVLWAVLAVCTLLLRAATDLRTAVVAVAAGTCLVVCLDQLTGARLALLSPLGYCAAAGARYYGLGNELLGVLLGAVLLVRGVGGVGGGGALRGILPTLFALGCAAVVAGPNWGTNFGGAMVFSAWFAASLAAAVGNFRHKPISAHQWCLLAGGGLLAGAALVVGWHTNAPIEVSTHVGELFSPGRGEDVTALMSRKASTALRVFRYTVWTRAWLFLLAVYALVSFRPVGWIRDAFARRPELSSVCRTSVALSLAALISNDSGVVTAALTVLSPVAVMLLALGEEVAGHERRE